MGDDMPSIRDTTKVCMHHLGGLKAQVSQLNGVTTKSGINLPGSQKPKIHIDSVEIRTNMMP
jgi:hypothetical protein